jgi:hypothetical protein
MELKNLSLGERIMSLESPNAFLGLLAALVAVAILVRVVISEFTTIELPHLPVSWERADLFAAAAVAALLYGGYQRTRETPTFDRDNSVTSI